jgi:hypothetical protein
MWNRRIAGLKTRYIPTGAVEKLYPEVNAVVYLTGEKGAIGYTGKANTHSFHYGFQTPARRDEYIANWMEGLKKKQVTKAQKQEERKLPHTLVVGDIMVYSWGYDQTNIDFYQVISVTPKTVKVQKIYGQAVDGSEGFMCCNVVPVKSKFISKEVLTKKVDKNGYASMSFGCMSKWDGRPRYQSWYA